MAENAGAALRPFRDTRPLPQDRIKPEADAVLVGAALCRERAAEQPLAIYQWLTV
ncbi:hypothetical protein D3C81_1538170 [compost metagenome]